MEPCRAITATAIEASRSVTGARLPCVTTKPRGVVAMYSDRGLTNARKPRNAPRTPCVASKG